MPDTFIFNLGGFFDSLSMFLTTLFQSLAMFLDGIFGSIIIR